MAEEKNLEEQKLETKDRYAFASEKSRKQIFIDNAIGGLAWGVGSVIGATIIIGLLGLIISRSRNIPLIGDVVNVIIEEINQGQNADIFTPEEENQSTNPPAPQPTANPPLVVAPPPENPVSSPS